MPSISQLQRKLKDSRRSTLDQAADLRSWLRRTALSEPVRADLPMAYEVIDGHLFVVGDDVWGAYRFGEALWTLRTAEEQAGLLAMAAAAYASLPGRSIQIITDTKPDDARRWASEWQRTAEDPSEHWDQHVVNCANRIITANLIETAAGIIVRLGKVGKGGDLAAVEGDDVEVKSHLAALGIAAQPCSPDEIAWFIHRAAAPGIDPPEGDLIHPVWTAEDMAEFTEDITWEAPPGDRVVKVTAYRDGQEHESYVSTLTMGRMQPRTMPSKTPPWAAAAARQPFPVSVVISGELIAGRDAAKAIRERHAWVSDNIAHHVEHGLKPSQTLVEAEQRASQLADDLTNPSDPLDVARFSGVIRFVVTGSTRAECLDHVRQLRNYYRDHVKCTLVHNLDTITAMRELRPGTLPIRYGYRRDMPALLLAAAVPNVTGQVGTPSGMYLGYTSGDTPRRAVLHDPHYPMQVLNRAGLYAVLGDPGAGRSTLGSRVLYEAALAGQHAVALDPAGEWTALANIPEIANRVAVVDLMEAAAGILAANRVLPDPPRGIGQGDADYEREAALIRAQRTELLQDQLTTLLDPDLTRGDLGRALKRAIIGANGNPWAVIERLAQNPDHEDLVEALRQLSAGSARLIFPDQDSEAQLADLYSTNVVIITMSGMQFPAATVARENWTGAERIGATVLNSAAYLTRRLIEAKPRRAPKVLVVDEAHYLANWDSGQSFIANLVRHVRRWNLAVYLLTQHPADLRKLDPTGNTFVCGGWIGYHESPTVAAEALALFDIHPQYLPVVQSLTWLNRAHTDRLPGEFIHIDAMRRPERMRVDIEHLVTFKRETNTTPGLVLV